MNLANLPQDMLWVIWRAIGDDTSRGLWRVACPFVARQCPQPAPVPRGPSGKYVPAALRKSRLMQAAYDGHMAAFAHHVKHPSARQWQDMNASVLWIAMIQGGALDLYLATVGTVPPSARLASHSILHYALAHGRETFLITMGSTVPDPVTSWFEQMDEIALFGYVIEVGSDTGYKCKTAPQPWCMLQAVQHRAWSLVDRYLVYRAARHNTHHFYTPRAPYDVRQLLMACAAHGHIEALRAHATAADCNVRMVTYAIANGDTAAGLVYLEQAYPDMVRAALESLVHPHRLSRAVKLACKRGHVPVLQWLHARGALSLHDTRIQSILHQYLEEKPLLKAWMHE